MRCTHEQKYSPITPSLLCVVAAGVEVGQHAGFVAALRALQQEQPGTLPPRSDRNLAAMEECLLQFPLYDPTVRHIGGGQQGGHRMCMLSRQRSTEPLCHNPVMRLHIMHIMMCRHAGMRSFMAPAAASQPMHCVPLLLLHPG